MSDITNQATANNVNALIAALQQTTRDTEIIISQGRSDVIAVVSTTGAVKFYETYAQAVANLGAIPNDALVEIMRDESRANARTRYFKRAAGALEFAVNLDELRAELAASDGLSKVGGLNTFMQYPSRNILGYGRNWFDIEVPATSDFIDNVFSVQNKSTNGSIYGNAAFAFLDRAGIERGAMGYSRNQAIQPGGYYPNTLYLEIGNPFTTDAQVTHLRCINTIKEGGPFWGGAGRSYFPIEVRADTGDITLDAGSTGGGRVHVKGGPLVTDDIAIGDLSIPGVYSLSNAMSTTAVRFRERRAADQYAITTNMANDVGGISAQDNPSLTSWQLSMGGGLNEFSIGITPAGSNATAANVKRFIVKGNGRVMVGQEESGAGYDGLMAITGQNGWSALSLRSTTALPAQVVYNSMTTGNNQLVAFGTEASYVNRGSITFNRAGGLIAYNTTSDYRAKDILSDFSESGAVIDRLAVYLGQMKGATQARPMFIAHEVQEVASYAVTGEKDAVDEKGNPVLQVMDASALIPLLFAEVKSLRGRVAKLESA